jgi:hypothetical protein
MHMEGKVADEDIRVVSILPVDKKRFSFIGEV